MSNFPFFVFPTIQQPADENSLKKKAIRRAGSNLRGEIIKCIEQQVLVDDQEVSSPIFFVKSYNFLEQECAEINHQDPILEFLPRVIEMVILTEAGPSPQRPSPILGSNGLLTNPTRDSSFSNEVKRFAVDIVRFVRNEFELTDRFPSLPNIYVIMNADFERKIEQHKELQTPDNYELLENMPIVVEYMLRSDLGDVAPDGYADI